VDQSLYQPVATCDIPMPIVETPASGSPGGGVLPRILLQAVSSRGASRRLVVLTMMFLALSILEGALLVRMRVADPLVVYHDIPRRILLEPEHP
jgi:hypothetical protein